MPLVRTASRPAPLVRVGRVLLVSAGIAACSDQPSITSPASPAASPAAITAFAKGAAGNSRPIVYSSDGETPGRSQLYLLNPDTFASTRITNSSGNDVTPAWSPDGKRIAFVRAPTDLSSSTIWVMNADGTGATPITSSQGFNLSPSWSKDGRRIAFASTRAAADPTIGANDSTDVFVMNDDGTNVTRLTFSPRQDAQPAWSPDGRQIAFASARDLPSSSGDGNAEVYVMNADGTQVRRLTHFNGTLIQGPRWSPDGRTLAFAAGTSGVDVFTMRPDGTGQAQLTLDGQSGFPGWSPDGNLIVFASARDDADGIAELYTMRPDGTGATRLTVSAGNDLQPAWFR